MSDPGDDTPRVIAGRYRLTGKVGQGGMGTVWKASDDLLGRTVAIKEVDLRQVPTAERPMARERTLREARVAARLSHPNAVTVFDVVEEDGKPWIVMSLVLADSLAEVIAERGPLAPERAAEIGLALLSALEAAHKVGILHRDVKPSNVLIGDDGTVVLTDFGIATLEGDVSLTSTGMLFGAPAYIAPERARGQRPGPASDLWSLGATLYTAVEGKPPFDRESPMATLTALVSEELPVPRSAGRLAPALHALLERDPQRRADPAKARQLLEQALPGRRADPATRALPAVGVPHAATRTMQAQPPGVGPLQPPQQPPAWGLPAEQDPHRQAPRRRSRAPIVALVLLALALAGVVATAIVLAGGDDKTGTVAKPNGSSGQPSPGQPSPGASSPAPTPTPSPTKNSPASGWPTLRQGSSSTAVFAAQHLLGYKGYEPTDEAATGSFDAATTSAVKAFQRDQGLAESGEIDGSTWTLLAAPANINDEGGHVIAAQILLNAVSNSNGAGYDLKEDGVFGKQTETAVRDFERAAGLPVDGIVSLRVWRALLARTS